MKYRMAKIVAVMVVLMVLLPACGHKDKTRTKKQTKYRNNPALLDERDRLNEQIVALDELILARDAEIDRLNLELSEQVAQVAELSGQLAGVSDQSTAEASRVAELQEKVATLEGVIATLDKQGNLVLVLENKVFFKSGSANLNESAKSALLEVSTILTSSYADKNISIDGHSDSDPIIKIKSKYKTNWELSGARSMEVLHFIVDEGKVEESRLSSRSFSKFKPVAKNDSRDNKAKNRRVEIVILND